MINNPTAYSPKYATGGYYDESNHGDSEAAWGAGGDGGAGAGRGTSKFAAGAGRGTSTFAAASTMQLRNATPSFAARLPA